MAVTATVANKIKYLILTKDIDLETDTFKCCLMQAGFSFDEDAHHYYADISASELVTGNGYTSGGATMSGVSVTEDDSADRGNVSWAHLS